MESKNQKNTRDKLQLIKGKEVEILYDQAKVSILAAQSATLVFIFAMWGHAASAILLPWIIFFSVLNIARYMLVTAYFKAGNRSDNYTVWNTRFLIGTALSGLLWGIFALLTLPIEVRGYTALTMLVITGLAGGSIGTYAISRPAYLIYASTSLLPLGIILVIQEESTLRTFGVLVLVYYAFLSVSMFRINKMLKQVVNLQFDNVELLRQLEKEKELIAGMNQKLELDIENHIDTEKELIDAKIKAEGLADDLSRLTVQDALTGIANRRGFDAFLSNAWARAIRNQSPISVMLCDVDFFKNYNDFYGHPEGDEVLKNIAITIESRSRKGSDLAARYGGEEFVIVLPDTELNVALIVAEKIRSAIESLKIPHEKSNVNEYITISLGVVCVTPNRDMDSSALVKQADEALYSAKEAGRNQVYPAIKQG
ncbi:MAG: diguanylate cyclase [Gammaproteobacteria bacterium]|nr:diguanylate cyclase [Gammaproteobacteria bacterium]